MIEREDETVIDEVPAEAEKTQRSRLKVLGIVLGALLIFGAGAVVGSVGNGVDTVSLDQASDEIERLTNDNETISAGLDEVIAERDEAVVTIAELNEAADEITEEQERRAADLDARATDLDELQADLAIREEVILGEEKKVIDNTIAGDGIWIVGEDIDPGTYRAKGSSDSCYWARLSGLSGELDDIIANHLGSANTTAEIGASDEAFETTRCGEWTKQ